MFKNCVILKTLEIVLKDLLKYKKKEWTEAKLYETISPTFECQAKSRWRTSLSKSLPFSFTNILRRWNLPNMYSEICQINLPFGEHHLLSKKLLILFARKSLENMFVKSTPGVERRACVWSSWSNPLRLGSVWLDRL